jgi:hypothetical protein
MRKWVPILILVALWACQSKERRPNATPAEESKPILSQPKELANEVPQVSAEELQTFWDSCIEPIKNLDKEKLNRIVSFPLEGEWGYLIGLEKDGKELNEADFYNNLDKVFYPEFLDSLQKKTIKDLEISMTAQKEPELLLSLGFEKWMDDFKAESSIILRFKKIQGKWMLYVIQLAG